MIRVLLSAWIWCSRTNTWKAMWCQTKLLKKHTVCVIKCENVLFYCLNSSSHTWISVSFRGVLWLLQSCRGQFLSVLLPAADAEFSRGLLLNFCCRVALFSNKAHRALVPDGSFWGRKSMERLLDRLKLPADLVSCHLQRPSTQFSETWQEFSFRTFSCWFVCLISNHNKLVWQTTDYLKLFLCFLRTPQVSTALVTLENIFNIFISSEQTKTQWINGLTK